MRILTHPLFFYSPNRSFKKSGRVLTSDSKDENITRFSELTT